MKNKTILIIAIFLLITSITIALYPTVSNSIIQGKCNNSIEMFNQRKDNYNITKTDEDTVEKKPSNSYEQKADITTDHETDTTNISESDYNDTPYADIPIDIHELVEDSQKYNESLKERQSMDVDFTRPALHLNKYGIWDNMYGYITAETIGMNLPIYLGSTDDNMAYGAVHLYGTSLPIGGDDTNCVLAGHTGYIGRSFFDNIRYLEVGDSIKIVNYTNILTYKVESNEIIGLSDTDNLYIRPCEDRLVLMTCIHGGSDRYIVICRRES